jgi:membrane glycosyltransferase
VFMYGMLLAPKFMGASSIHMTGLTLKKLGGFRQFIMSFLIEVVFSVAFAPILMVQQMIAVIRTFAGFRERWVPQQRAGGHYSWAVLMKFHSVETLGGLLLVAGMAGGLVSLWLLPIALSLLAAIPLSALSGVNLRQWRWARSHLGTPEEFDEPEIIRLARAHRQWLRLVLEPSPADRIAAE